MADETTAHRKRCATCKQEKPRNAFGVDQSRSDGYTDSCRECRNVQARSGHRKRVEAEGRILREKVPLPEHLAKLPGKFKRCPDCEEFKPADQFGRNKTNGDGLAAYCKPCFRERSNAQYRRKAEREGRAVRDKFDVPPGHKRCPDCREIKSHAEWSRNSSSSDGFTSYCKACKSVRDARNHFKQKYGLSPDQLDRMVADQGGLCAICRERKAVHVDHDHHSGNVRAVLCFQCNAMLGQVQDDPGILLKAVVYLASHGGIETIHSPAWPGWLVDGADPWMLGA